MKTIAGFLFSTEPSIFEAITTANVQKKRFPFGNLSVGLPGLEPGKAGPESAVLPLHHSPMLKCDAKVLLFFVKKIFSPFFLLKK